MNETNLTPRANQVLANAKVIAAKYNHTYIGTEHLLLAILDVNQGFVPNWIEQSGINPVQLRANIQKIADGEFNPQLSKKPELNEIAKLLRELADKIA